MSIGEEEKDLYYRATHDQLTGLYNRWALEDLVRYHFCMAKRVEKQFCLVLFDIDGFKRLNDFWGHLAGDCVLRGFALSLLNRFRASDIVARWGGDEFLVFMPDIRLSPSKSRVAIFMAPPAGYGNVESSHGIARYPYDGVTFDELFAAADRRLYQEKEEKVITFSKLKKYAREKHGLRVASEVKEVADSAMEVLMDWAAESAKRDKRTTIKARDLVGGGRNLELL